MDKYETYEYIKSLIMYCIIGALGGWTVALNSSDLSMYQKFAATITGALCAAFLTPFFCYVVSFGDKFDMTIEAHGFFAFITGNLGIKGITIVIEYFRSKFPRKKD